MKDLVNDFEVWQEALKKIDLNEGALPIYHGRILRENAKEYQKMQKILNCPEMIKCHKYIFDLDPEQLDESDCTKINNLYKLGVDRGFIEDTIDVPDEDLPDADYTASEQTAVQQPKPYVAPQHLARVPCYTVMYSAMKDGQIKTGESYSNATNPRAAKADVYAKLSKFGYDNIAILAIECGDPDSSMDNTYTFEDDILQNRVHNGHFLDEEDAEKKEDKPAEDTEKKEEQPKEEASAEKKEETPAEQSEENAEQPAEQSTEQSAEQSAEQPTEQPTEQPAEQSTEQPAEDIEKKEEVPAEQPEENADNADNEQSTEDAESSGNSENAETSDGNEETKSSDDNSSEDASKEELDDNKKAELKDEYRKTFKNVMTKCQFDNRCFDDLTIAEKVQFFTAMASSWTKNEPNEFMTDKEIEQLNKIVIEN